MIPWRITLRIFRLEDKNGYGPYRDIKNEDIIENNEDERHPIVKVSCLVNFVRKMEYKESDIFFGFDSIEKLKEWFSEEVLSVLLNRGYKIFEYKVPIKYNKCFDKQFIFIMDKAERLKEVTNV